MRSTSLRKGLAVAVLAASAAGCGATDRATVSGQVKESDGTPVAGALVVARCDETGASGSGETGSDGSYQLGGSQPGDGIAPGNYSVTVLSERKGLQDGGGGSAAKVPAKYGSHATSGLSFSVAAGDAKQFDITLNAP
jgi:hypothetical protein